MNLLGKRSRNQGWRLQKAHKPQENSFIIFVFNLKSDFYISIHLTFSPLAKLSNHHNKIAENCYCHYTAVLEDNSSCSKVFRGTYTSIQARQGFAGTESSIKIK